MAYDLTPRVGDSAHRLLFKIAAATSDVDDPPNPDAPENQLLRRIAAATAAGAGAGVAFEDITGDPTDNAALAAALALKLDKSGGIFTGNGAASTPALTLNGTPFSGGSATTTKPLHLIEPSGTTSNNWNTNGTLSGLNAPSGFLGNIFDAQINASSRLSVSNNQTRIYGDDITGQVLRLVSQYGTANLTVAGGGSLFCQSLSASYIASQGVRAIDPANSAYYTGIHADATSNHIVTNSGVLNLGDLHATTPTNQTFKAHDVTTGTCASLTLAGGSGSVAKGNVVLDGGNRAAYDAAPSTTVIRDILISHGLMAAS